MTIAPPQDSPTLQDLSERFGPMPMWRVRTGQYPATEEDVLWIQDHEDRTCELIDGVLIEKDIHATCAVIGTFVCTVLHSFVRPRRLGFVAGSSGVLRLTPNRLRAPDIAFVRRDQTPDGRAPKEPIPDLYPTLAVEVLSPGNTTKEMDEKLDDYFQAGSEAVWLIDPATKTVRVFTGRQTETTLKTGDVLDGGNVLSGFGVPVDELFGAVELGESDR